VGSDAIEPPQLPVTILDTVRANGCFDMHHHMSDPCPECGAFRMQVGDWVCYGICGACYEKHMEELEME